MGFNSALRLQQKNMRRLSQRICFALYLCSCYFESSSTGNEHRRRNSLESLFCYDTPIPEERIEKSIGVSLSEKVIGDNPRCTECKAKGAVLCATCSSSGLYVDSILESQGIIVKVCCLSCGGIGNIMCAECGGRGHCSP
ncbi:calcium-dependent protein kinase 8 [Citrus sinensis]|uniref:Uncharacterized protein n=1 Tax=Citrus clementina TaxID=85681 RepID=V4UQ95_CITCL|nr:hypothetical protein CICLE_v10013836mg [Citrus x clementina]KAH9705058.1 calcium-dependent protein kinase 8 [Citrus sinensis]